MLLPPVKANGKSGRKYFFFWKDLLTLLWWSGKLQVVSLKPGDDIWILLPSASSVSYSDITRIFASVLIVITCFLPVSWLFAAPQYNGLYHILFCQNPSIPPCAFLSHPTGQGSSGSEWDCSVMCLSRSIWTGGFRRVCKFWVAYFCCLSFGIQAENLIRWKRCHEKSCFLSAGRRIDARTCT